MAARMLRCLQLMCIASITVTTASASTPSLASVMSFSNRAQLISDGDGSESDASTRASTSDEDDGFTGFFGNPTRFGPQARGFLDRASEDICGLVETHVDSRHIAEH